MKIRPPILRAWNDTVDVDLFAGGGGASDGARRATGRSPDVAVNHWPIAIAMHEHNHPDCRHYVEDVWKVNPLEATRGRRCRLLWASPTCTHFSRAKGARLSPDTIKIRGLAWSIIPWIATVWPDVIIVENVIEFLGWGPICWQHIDRCRGDRDGKTCVDACGYGRPIKSRMGETFRAWERRVRSFGYSFEVRKLVAWEYGAPTARERAYIVMRRDGKPFAFPEPTHTTETWRTAAEIIDWSIPCPSIFERKRPHVPATRRRLARGVRKFVLETAKPFILPVKTWGGGGNDPSSIDRPMRTITASKRGEFAIAVPYMIHRSNGERPGQEPRVYDVNAPHPTLVAGGLKTSPVVAFLAKAYSERPTGGWNGGSELAKPIGAVTAQDHHHLVAAHIVKYYGTSTGSSCAEPLHTICAQAEHLALSATALVESTAPEWNDDIAAKARRVYAFLVAEGIEGPWMDHEAKLVRLPGTGLVIYDLGMRMLSPRELFRANGFDDTYIIDFLRPDGRPLTKTEQVRLVGNSVCPDVAEALIRAALAPMMKSKRTRGEQLSMLEAA